MTRTYLYGYNDYQTRLTEEELLTRWSWKMVHPEMRRRSLRMAAASQDAGHDVGFGSGARDPKVQLLEALRRHTVVPCSEAHDRKYEGRCYKLKPGFSPYAFPGSSNHETGILNGYAIAIDYVGWEDHWFDKNCEFFGIKNFGGKVGDNVNGEEWHGQPIEFSNARSDVNKEVAAGRRLSAIPLPGVHTPLPPLPDPRPIPIYQGVPDMFTPIHPKRNSDTRIWPGPIPANQTVEFGLDPAVFPINTVAVAMSVTALNGIPGAFLTIWGSGPVPDTSVLNFEGAIANGSYVGPVAGLKFMLRASAPMNVICDVTGYWTP